MFVCVMKLAAQRLPPLLHRKNYYQTFEMSEYNWHHTEVISSKLDHITSQAIPVCTTQKVTPPLEEGTCRGSLHLEMWPHLHRQGEWP